VSATKYRFYKHQKTFNEKKQYDVEYGRPKRNPSNLPDDYDDRYSHKWKDKSWKNRYKKEKQWMRKKCKKLWLKFGTPGYYIIDNYSGLEGSTCDMERFFMRKRNQDKEKKKFNVHGWRFVCGRFTSEWFYYE